MRLTKRRFAARKGSTARFTLSEAATVKVAVQRARSRGRWTTVRTFTRPGRAGANRIAVKGRPPALRPGAYRLVVLARDAAGNTSARRVAPFRITRPRG